MTNLEILDVDAVDAPHVVDGNQLRDGVVIAGAAEPLHGLPQLVAATTISQTDEDGRLRALDGEVRDADVLHHAAVNNLKREGRRTYL